ncbi:uncharacterized protein Z518_02293 [Rhinocladiella mackenziei CBS 650.93]|uniref:SMODS and SLOG-associating 2TM effector domain-containing protein n=1 Tax=Rhinocladiella mackenziei CBS 650.93 TaxID=1442369 RepID=A0A0D2JEM5_9EURO|nr:uncharacterized protein Z518_02293 [Rhinocladiella mackenziei CBS 650.93]KIX07640.1 hypothetical protein Z518_02293 [Rhinocladiella mackenziei CBS 650.93]
MTASLSNTMLLSQVVLGAALTALGASESSHVLITVFGAMNTIIAGLVAYLKSRGQPMRARMYRDDLERVVDEIENSEIMWLGISRGRAWRAVRNNTVNNPDMYMAGAGNEGYSATLRSRPAGGAQGNMPLPIAGSPQPVMAAPVVGVDPGPPGPKSAVLTQQPQAPDLDESPVTAKPTSKEEQKEEPKKEEEKAEEDGDAKGTVKGKEKHNEKEKDGKKDEPSPSNFTSDGPASKADAGTSGTSSNPPLPQQKHDPDAEPASDPNVPLKKDSMDGES